MIRSYLPRGNLLHESGSGALHVCPGHGAPLAKKECPRWEIYTCRCWVWDCWFGYGSIPINTIFRGMNIHLLAILMFTRGTRFWSIPIYYDLFEISDWWCNMNTLLWLIVHIYITRMYMIVYVWCVSLNHVSVFVIFLSYVLGRAYLEYRRLCSKHTEKELHIWHYDILWLWFYWGKWLTHIWGDGWARHSCCLTAGLIEWIKMTDPSFRVKRVCFKHPKRCGKPTVSG